jgi:hypothetical protein
MIEREIDQLHRPPDLLAREPRRGDEDFVDARAVGREGGADVHWGRILDGCRGGVREVFRGFIAHSTGSQNAECKMQN